MARFTTRIFGLSGCLLALLCAVPVQADPFFVRSTAGPTRSTRDFHPTS